MPAGACGLTVAALDAPGHGGRPRSAAPEAAVAALPAAIASGSASGAVAALDAEVAAVAVPEWRAVLDAVLDGGHARAPVGFVGLSMGAAIGVRLLATEPRITAAVIGLVGGRGLADHAARITAAVQVVVQWDDEVVERDDALALFTAIGSSEKSLHANPGGHAGVPATERESGERFLAHHLLDAPATTTPSSAEPARRGGGTEQRLRRGVVLRVEEESCEVLIEDQPVSARYASALPSPRAERAVVIDTRGEQVQVWEPAHGQVLTAPRRPGQDHRPGTRAYLSAGLAGAEWWLAGPVTATAEEADVELDEVERFCTQHGLWDQPT